mgnify:CR=1 FL=1
MGLVAAYSPVPLTGAEAGQLRLRSNMALLTHHVESATTTPWPVGSQDPAHAVQPCGDLAVEVVLLAAGCPPPTCNASAFARSTVHEGGAHQDGHNFFRAGWSTRIVRLISFERGWSTLEEGRWTAASGPFEVGRRSRPRANQARPPTC